MKNTIKMCALATCFTFLFACTDLVEDPNAGSADLASLTVSSGVLSPAFASATLAYTVNIPFETEEPTVSATTLDPAATLVFVPAATVKLGLGETKTISIRVTPTSGGYKEYTLNLTRATRPADYISPNIGTLKGVPPGSFVYSQNSGDISTVLTFRMATTTITRAQYLAVMGVDPSDTSYSSSGDSMEDPVQNISWYDALAFCNKLSIKEGLTPVYTLENSGYSDSEYNIEVPVVPASTDPSTWGETNTMFYASTAWVETDWTANGYRLPTLMEFYWAAMGSIEDSMVKINDNQEVDELGYFKIFPGDDGSNTGDLGDYVWDDTNSDGKTHPVAQKKPNELGIYDLVGNVFQWCWDARVGGEDPVGAVTDYRGAHDDPEWGLEFSRYVYGCNFQFSPAFFSISYATPYYVDNTEATLGLRVVRN